MDELDRLSLADRDCRLLHRSDSSRHRTSSDPEHLCEKGAETHAGPRASLFVQGQNFLRCIGDTYLPASAACGLGEPARAQVSWGSTRPGTTSSSSPSPACRVRRHCVAADDGRTQRYRLAVDLVADEPGSSLEGPRSDTSPRRLRSPEISLRRSARRGEWRRPRIPARPCTPEPRRRLASAVWAWSLAVRPRARVPAGGRRGARCQVTPSRHRSAGW